MSYFVLGVGGTGAKLIQTLVHLSAAGLPSDPRRNLDCLLIDPDDANGNVDECKKLVSAYNRCAALQTGECNLFARTVEVRGPWTPLRTQTADTLNEIFHFTQRQGSAPVESELMELFFTEEERAMKIHQGFRGRPAIGATVLSSAIDFADENDIWKRLVDKARGAGNFDTGVPVLLAGSVFGGSGAAGVPTILQLLRKPLADVGNVRLGLILFLPYFTFAPVPNELIQAIPADFDHATAEAIKYYAERGFLDKCHSVYAVGEQFRATLPVAAVGAAAQRNEPHFLELVAGLGALRFFDDGARSDEEHSLSIAGRRDPSTLSWDDLPTTRHLHESLVAKLQRMIVFAVSYHLSFYPRFRKELSAARDSRESILQKYVFRERLPKEDVQRDLALVEDYVVLFLTWLLRVSTPRVEGFRPGLVDVGVFAERSGAGEWTLRGEFRNEKDLRSLFLNAPGRKQPDLNTIWKRTEASNITDPNAKRTGRLLRALYDSCE